MVKESVLRGFVILLAVYFIMISTPVYIIGRNLPPKPFAGEVGLNTVSYPELVQLVLGGKEVTGRLVAASDIVRVLEDAPALLKQSSYAALKLRACRVEGSPVRLQAPSLSVEKYSIATQEHLKKRDLNAGVYLGLPVEIRNAKFAAGFILKNVVLQKTFIVENTDFSELVSFQGAVFGGENAIFDHVTFQQLSDFSGALFLNPVTFDGCSFNREANFSYSALGPPAQLVFTGDSVNVPLNFSESTISGKLTLQGSERTLKLTDKVYLNGINRGLNIAGELAAKNVEFGDSLYLDRSRLARVDFAEDQAGLHRPIRFKAACDFREAIFDYIDLGGAEFEGGGDFSRAEFRTAIDLERTMFRQPMRIDWDAIAGKLRQFSMDETPPGSVLANRLTKESYEELERNFKQLEDLYGENECRFEKRTIWEGKGFQWAVSGYWTRPEHTLLVITLLLLLFFWINWVASHRRRWLSRTQRHETLLDALRVPNCLQLALYATALRTSPPEDFDLHRYGRLIFWVEYASFKVMEVFLIVTISNRSALLKQLLPYFKIG